MSSIPSQMKAAIINGYGPILETVQVSSVSVPEPKDDEVLIRVHFASINPIDNLITLGQYQSLFSLQFPYILGYDVSGVVASVGSKVTKFKVGDEVFSRVQQGHGTLAEYVAESENVVSLKPSSLSHAEAAAVPLVALTATQVFQQKLKPKKGDKILITGAAGGVGTFATQIANNVYGAFVSGTASESKHAVIAPLLTKGQFNLIDYKNVDFTKTLSSYDSVFDTTGEVMKELSVVRRGGKVVSISQQPPTPDSVKNFGLPESTMQALAAANAPIFKAAGELGVEYEWNAMHSSAEDLNTISSWIQQNKVKVVLDKTFTLDQAAEALAYLAQGRATGKVVIQIV